MKKILTPLIRILSIIIICTLFFTLMNTLAFMLPVSEKNYAHSFEFIEKEGWCPQFPLIGSAEADYFAPYQKNYTPLVFDNSTMRVVLQTAFERREGMHFPEALKKAMVPSYTRYWHGYVSILRPIMILFDYEKMQILNSFLVFALAALVACVFYKNGGMGKALMYLTSVILISPMLIGICFQYTWVFHIAQLAILIYFKNRDYLSRNDRIIYFFLIIGAVTVYLDFLTYPLYTWALPMLTIILFEKDGEYVGKKGFVNVLKAAGGWIAGYFGLWLCKWIIGSAILGQNLFSDAFSQASLRMGELLTFKDKVFGWYQNWKHYSYELFAVILAAWLVWWIVSGIRKGYEKSTRAIALSMVALSPAVWYAVLADHAYYHHIFTFRTLSIMFTAGIALMLDSVSGEKKLRKGLKSFVIPGCVSLVIAAAAIALTLVSREYDELSNKESTAGYEIVQMEDGEILEFDFVPSFRELTGICIGLQSESSKGDYVYEVYDGGSLVYTLATPIGSLKGYNYYLIRADWKLEPGKTYHFTARAEGNDAPVNAYVSSGGSKMLNEIRDPAIGQKSYPGEVLAGFAYWYRAPSRYIKACLAAFWFGVLAVGGYAVWSIWGMFKGSKNKKDKIS